MRRTKTWAAAALAAGLTLGACGSGKTSQGKTSSGSPAGSSTTHGETPAKDGLAQLDSLRRIAGKSIPRGDVYANTVKADGATAERMMAENQRPHADSNDVQYDESSATKIRLNGTSAAVEGPGASSGGGSAVTTSAGKVTISKAGTYVLSGDFTGQVFVKLPKTAKVKLVLKGANITSPDNAAIRIVEADEAVIALAEGTANTLSDASSYAFTVKGNGPIAALASKADLTIGGGGTLDVRGNSNDGISSSDGLVVTGGTVKVTARDDAIRGQDYVVLAAGTFDLKAGNDGVKSDNKKNAGRGYVLVTGGTANVVAKSDALEATSDLIVTGGSVNAAGSEEGFEASKMLLAGGSATVTTSDDGLNAVNTATKPWMAITGGDWTLNTEGDGFDSDGDGVISGGKVTVYGPSAAGNGAVDVENGLTLSGGTLLAVGSVGMDEAPKTTPGQSAIKAQADIPAGGRLAVADSTGGEIAAYTSPKPAKSVVFSSPRIKKGDAYAVTVNGQKAAAATGGDYK